MSLLLRKANRVILEFFTGIFIFATMAFGGMGSAFAACGENQIDVLGDGTQCVNGKFAIKTTNLNADDEFKFTMTAAGTFTVDCGTDGVLTSSADDITNGNTITRSDTTIATYTCTYTTGGVKTIAFDGLATNYSTAYQDSGNNYYAAIAFSGINGDVSTEPLTPTKIASVSGNLSSIFPYISGNSASGAQPRFYRLFSDATNLTTVPDTLFADYTKGATQMFAYTFLGCTGLTSIPAGLFSGITTGADSLFYATFSYCAGLQSIPAGLFSSITTGAASMFRSTFNRCAGLTSIPADLFSGITTGADSLFYATFYLCTGLTSIPSNLFSGITTGASWMFYYTFNSCTGLTSIPAGLFSSITTGASYMFGNTFQGCTRLTSIPADLFSSIKTVAARMFYQTFAGCTGLQSIPADLFSGITTGANWMFRSTFDGCTGLTTIPAGLFSGIKTSASNMFYYTFNGCTNLSGYIPPSTFAGLIANGHPTATDMWYATFSNTKLATSCPAGTVQYTTGYESEWNGKVSCTDVHTVTYSCGDATGTAPANSAVVTGSTFVPAENSCSKPGYVFYGWGVSGTDDTVMKPFTWNYSGNKTLTAQWGLGKFNLTTTNLDDNDEFKFTMTAQGTFTVDCGADGTLTSSADDITNGNTITRNNVTQATYTCTYSTGGVKTIAFDGTATNYSTARQDSNNNYYAAIAFSGRNSDVTTEPLTPTKIASISGNLSSIFPYISGNTAGGAQPRFYRLFSGATNLTTVPDTLFADYTKGAQSMFSATFYVCTGLTSIPAGLFSGITTSANYMFYYTFYNCTGLTSIPAGLFSGITTGASNMFQATFSGCTGLTSIPADLFSGITTGADYMFYHTFYNCTGLTSIPAGLFSNITTGADYMFYSTFYGCTGLTSIPSNLFSGITTGANDMFRSTFNRCSGLTSIPADLFSGISTGAERMFYYTFYGCSNLSGYIPATTFSGLIANGHPTATDMWQYTFNNTKVATSCPTGTTQYTTGYESVWNGKVSCVPDSENTTSTVTYSCGDATGTPPVNSAVVTGSTFVPAENTCSKPGYVFYGWGVSGTDDTVIKPFTWNYSGNKTLTAQWGLGKFNLTTTNLDDNDVFKFTMTAQGTFTVDCGADGTLTSSADDITNGNTITRSNTTIATYTCTYTTGGVKTIAFDGLATNYNNTYQDSNNNPYAAIAFSGINADVSTESLTPTKIASVSGNLSSIFPYISGNTTNGAQPRFYRLFYGATNLTTVPDTLFADYTKGAAQMFLHTFRGCTGLTSIPAGLFSGITTGASYMFYATFSGCTGLTSIPAGLFSKITTSAQYMFYATFHGCSGLTSIPADLFSGITTGAYNMFANTFYNCTGLTSIPAGLFSGITVPAGYTFQQTFLNCSGLTSIPAGLFSGITTSAEALFQRTFAGCTGLTSIPENLFFPNATSVTGATQMFYGTFYGCTGLTSIPAGLFSGITTGAEKMFYQTFQGCTNLSGYIPPSTFAGLIANGSPTATDMWQYTFNNTKVATSCPTGTVQYTTGYESEWNGKVSCVPDSENTTSTVTYSCGDATGTAPANSAVVTGSTFVPAQNTCSKPGYVFYGWGVSGTNDMVKKPFTWNYSGNKTLTAQWGLGKFNLTTTNLDDNDVFKFTMTARGTFTVDCGADGTLTSSANDITNGNTITRSNTTIATYTCTYSTGGVKTIAFDGTATNYSTAYQDSNNNYYAAIVFSGRNYDVTAEPLTPTKIASVSGNLSAIFPYISGNNASGAQPRFYRLFNGATNLTTVPDTLFADYTTGANYMFSNTFNGCTSLTTIPAGLFSGITTGVAYMFQYTFSGCTGLTSIPAGLFSGITTGANYMFSATFYGCTGLTSIPADLFSGITTGANYMFSNTFNGCTSLTTIPAGLFSGITTSASGLFYGVFQGCTGLTSIPAGLFSKITTGAASMFYRAFYECTGLTSIPAGLFSGITTGAIDMFRGTFYWCTGLTSIPADLFSGITTGAERMFYVAFYGCTGLTSIPAGLFSGITTGATEMFRSTFYGCARLTSIPADLFSGITTGAEKMFYQTFQGCTNLSGYIPSTTFAGLIANGSPTATDMWQYTFNNTKLATSCPAGTVQYMTGYEGNDTTNYTKWNGKVSCVEYPNQLCSPGEYLPNTASVCQPCTENSYCTGGTFTVNTAGAQGIDMCPNDWYSPAGMSSVDQCGRILHIGDNVVYLRSAKKTTPSLHIKVGDDVFYGNATTLDVPVHAGVERKLKVRYGNNTYSIYDDSVELSQYQN